MKKWIMFVILIILASYAFAGIDIEECQDCDGQVKNLTLRYLGDSSALIRVEQRNYDDTPVVYNDTVDPDEEFFFTGNFGNFDTLDQQIDIYVNDIFHTTIHTSCSRPIGIGMKSGNFEITYGTSRNGGLLCPSDDNETDCSVCEGQMKSLALKYLGSSSALITVEQKNPSGAIPFNDSVNPNENFAFNGLFGSDNTLDQEIYIFIDGVKNVTIPTSCSEYIAVGMVFEAFEVVEGGSKTGGYLCSEDENNRSPVFNNPPNGEPNGGTYGGGTYYGDGTHVVNTPEYSLVTLGIVVVLGSLGIAYFRKN